jgi:hypothetical protein
MLLLQCKKRLCLLAQNLDGQIASNNFQKVQFYQRILSVEVYTAAMPASQQLLLLAFHSIYWSNRDCPCRNIIMGKRGFGSSGGTPLADDLQEGKQGA